MIENSSKTVQIDVTSSGTLCVRYKCRSPRRTGRRGFFGRVYLAPNYLTATTYLGTAIVVEMSQTDMLSVVQAIDLEGVTDDFQELMASLPYLMIPLKEGGVKAKWGRKAEWLADWPDGPFKSLVSKHCKSAGYTLVKHGSRYRLSSESTSLCHGCGRALVRTIPGEDCSVADSTCITHWMYNQTGALIKDESSETVRLS